jgi:membrane protease YdiL (CAAX protease family)
VAEDRQERRFATSAHGEGTDAVGNPVLRCDTRGVVAFFVLAYVVGWAWMLPVLMSGRSIEEGRGWPTHFPTLLGPFLAAVVVTGWRERRLGLRRLGRRMVAVRFPFRWWAATLSPLIMLVVVAAGMLVTGRPLHLGDLSAYSGLSRSMGPLGVLVAVVLINGYGEETGWRGYAATQLQRRYSPLTAALIVAPLWAGWHLPFFFTLQSFRNFGPATTVGWLLGLTAGSVLLTWLLDGTAGSILAVALWHGGFNIVSATQFGGGLLAAVSTTMVMIAAVAIAVAWIRGRGPSPAVG